VITIERPTGRQPCETTWRTVTWRSTAPTAPARTHASSRKSAARAARVAADDAQTRPRLVDLPQEEVGREGVRVGQHQQRDALGGDVDVLLDAGEAVDMDRVLLLLDVEAERLDLALGEVGQPERERGPLLELAGPGHHRLHGRADQRVGARARTQLARELVERVGVLVRDERDGEVRPRAVHPAQRLAADLRDRRLGVGLGREGGGEAVHGARVSGVTIAARGYCAPRPAESAASLAARRLTRGGSGPP
jgi:hypothetical protein